MKDTAENRVLIASLLSSAPTGAVTLRVVTFNKWQSVFHGWNSEGAGPAGRRVEWVAANGDVRGHEVHPMATDYDEFLWPRVFEAALAAGVRVERSVTSSTLIKETRVVESWPAGDAMRSSTREGSVGETGYRDTAASPSIVALREAGFGVESRGAGDATVVFEKVRAPQPFWLLAAPLVFFSCAWLVFIRDLRSLFRSAKELTITGSTQRHEYIVRDAALVVSAFMTAHEPPKPVRIPLADVLAYSAVERTVITRNEVHRLPWVTEANPLIAFLEEATVAALAKAPGV